MKFISLRTLLVLVGLIGLYLLVRLYHFTSLPIFTDEAIYIRWSQIALHDATWRFIALTDGKGPFFTWVMFPFLALIKDPLIAGRMVSLCTGIVTIIGLFLLTSELFKNKAVSYITLLVYIAFPFAQVYDRMALYDSMVTTFAVWSLYLSILLVRRVRLDLAYSLGFILGAGVLTKANATFSALLLPLTLLLFNFKDSQWKKYLVRWFLFVVVSLVVMEGFYNLQRLTPFFGVINEKTALFVFPFKEWIYHPFQYFVSNFKTEILWLVSYFTPAYLLPLIFAFTSKEYLKEKLLLFTYFFIPFIVLALFGKLIYPRFIYFMVIMLLPLVSIGIVSISHLIGSLVHVARKNLILTVVVIIFLMYPLYLSLAFAKDPVHTQIENGDYHQYVYDWSAGWGVKESILYFDTISHSQKIFIGTEGTFGLLPQTLEMYLSKNLNIQTRGYWPIKDTIAPELLSMAKLMPTYVIFYQPCTACSGIGIAPSAWPVKKINVFHKEGTESNYIIYQVLSK